MSRARGTWRAAARPRAALKHENSHTGLTLLLGVEQTPVAVGVTLPYFFYLLSFTLELQSDQNTTRYSSKSRMYYNAVKVQRTIVLCFVCSSLLLCLGLGTVGLIDYFQCS